MQAEWYYLVGQQRLGPFTIDAMHAMRAHGVILGHQLVWGPGMADWRPADAVAAIGGCRGDPPTIRMATLPVADSNVSRSSAEPVRPHQPVHVHQHSVVVAGSDAVRAVCKCRAFSEEDPVIGLRKKPLADWGAGTWTFVILLVLVTGGGAIAFVFGWVMGGYWLNPVYRCQVCAADIDKKQFRG